MMKAIQRFGGALFTPAMLFAFAGVVVGLGTLFTTEPIMGPIAAAGTAWTKFWTVFLDGGWTVFNQLPLLFAVALPIGLAKKQAGRCCLEAFVAYLTFNYFVSSMLSAWAPELGVDFSATAGTSEGIVAIAGIRTLDMGIAGALLVSGVVIALHNRLFDTSLPEWLGVFSGSTFVYMVSFVVMLPLAGVAVLVWPKVQFGMRVFQQLVLDAGSAGVGVFVFLERVLIPFGLHHLLYAPFYYDNVIVQGGIYAAWANALPQMAASTRPLAELAPWASLTATGWSKLFGIPGIAAAFYVTAKPERRKRVLALLVPVTLTSILCGVTEPIEYTFLFVAPQLFVVHAALAACLSMTMNAFGVVGVFSGGLIEMSSLDFVPLSATHGQTYLVALGIGLCYTVIYFLVFRLLILRFDFKTPGRTDEEDIRLNTQDEYRDAHGMPRAQDGRRLGAAGEKADGDQTDAFATRLAELLGGAENIGGITSCATRLRVDVHDPGRVAANGAFVAAGARGAICNGRAVQVIVGLNVIQVAEGIQKVLGMGE
ncbi:alpha-glucoside-specific PTS transporter subunit IIBC [Olsenella sp. Marseille-P4559]|uniref:alpha-glucoside-specific PTS transporter subunit IIBC n=1 Tax=Olsenella sp. Marseille-P4559 TaxID=2364795 RepID=UPI00102FC7C4|nr:alpha-glucoside-specific PTS transporter subunit IIBC [Olsenella sp. Marseille-P4559]